MLYLKKSFLNRCCLSHRFLVIAGGWSLLLLSYSCWFINFIWLCCHLLLNKRVIITLFSLHWLYHRTTFMMTWLLSNINWLWLLLWLFRHFNWIVTSTTTHLSRLWSLYFFLLLKEELLLIYLLLNDIWLWDLLWWFWWMLFFLLLFIINSDS